MKRILFVDDEPRVLEGLQRMLRSQRKWWDMAFANSGAAALEMLASQPFDIVVTDMRMPEMDGAQLLTRVQERYPNVVRIVLSGHFERDAAMRAVPVAHQFLAKPCDPDKLCEAISRACEFCAILPEERIRCAVGSIGRLPALPQTCAALIEALETPDTPVEHIAKIVEQDVGIATKVLQLVNSAFFGLRQTVTSVPMAVGYLGLDTMKHLVLSVEIFRTFHPAACIPGFSIEGFEHHSRLAAKIAGSLPAPKPIASAAVLAAMLHDVGQLILATRMAGQLEEVLRKCRTHNVPLHEVEEDMLGTSHAEVGAYLLGLWGIPNNVVEAVYKHHRPEATEGSGQGLTVLGITHVADVLASEVGRTAVTDGPGSACRLDIDYLAKLGVADQVPLWRETAAELAREGAEVK